MLTDLTSRTVTSMSSAMARMFMLVVALLGLSVGLSASVAAESGPHYVCLKGISNRCLDLPPSGNQLQVDNGVQYDIHNAGPVNGPDAWPFTSGSGFNAKYNNDEVMEFQDPNDLSQCVRENSAHNTVITLGGCGTGGGSYFVADGNWIISVGATNDQGLTTASGPAVLGTATNSKGAFVDAILGGLKGYQDWSY